VLAQGHVAVFLAFTLADVKHFAVKVQVRKADVAGFKAAQAATVKQSQQHPVLKQFRAQQQALYFLLAQDAGRVLSALMLGSSMRLSLSPSMRKAKRRP
jgi:hypothetical protein